MKRKVSILIVLSLHFTLHKPCYTGNKGTHNESSPAVTTPEQPAAPLKKAQENRHYALFKKCVKIGVGLSAAVAGLYIGQRIMVDKSKHDAINKLLASA